MQEVGFQIWLKHNEDFSVVFEGQIPNPTCLQGIVSWIFGITKLKLQALEIILRNIVVKVSSMMERSSIQITWGLKQTQEAKTLF